MASGVRPQSLSRQEIIPVLTFTTPHKYPLIKAYGKVWQVNKGDNITVHTVFKARREQKSHTNRLLIRLNILLLRKEVNQNWSELESAEFWSAACLRGGSFQFFWKSITFPSYLLLYCTRILLYSLATQPSIIEQLYWHFNVQWRLELPQRFQLKKIQNENGERKKKKRKGWVESFQQRSLWLSVTLSFFFLSPEEYSKESI